MMPAAPPAVSYLDLAGAQLDLDVAALLAAEGDTPRGRLLAEAFDRFGRLSATLLQAAEDRATTVAYIAELLRSDDPAACRPPFERRRRHRTGRGRRCR